MAFYQTLSDGEQHELDWQLDDIFYAAKGYDAEDMKEYCSQAGYEPKWESYPAARKAQTQRTCRCFSLNQGKNRRNGQGMA